MSTVLYVTFDGLLQPLGDSQVVRYVERLAMREFDYVILSLERSRDLECPRRVRQLQKRLGERGVDWIYGEYSSGGGLFDVARNMSWMTRSALRICRERPIELVHARSYLGGLVAYATKAVVSVPYLFDIRGYWIDERLHEGRWFTNAVIEGAARSVERRLYQGADGLVTLTGVSARDVVRGHFGPWDRRKPVAVIPTCADYATFGSHDRGESAIPVLHELRRSTQLVVGYVGSINRAYHASSSLALFNSLRRRLGGAHLLCVTQQRQQMRALLDSHGIGSSQFTLVTVPHKDMPAVYDVMDWGFLMVSKCFARRAMMPTKLAEFFAAGVRPIYHGCNPEIRHWIEATNTGVIIEKLSPSGLEQTARQIANRGDDRLRIRRARRQTRDHFGLEAGTDRYEEICELLIERGLSPQKDKMQPEAILEMERRAQAITESSHHSGMVGRGQPNSQSAL